MKIQLYGRKSLYLSFLCLGPIISAVDFFQIKVRFLSAGIFLVPRVMRDTHQQPKVLALSHKLKSAKTLSRSMRCTCNSGGDK